MSFFIKLLGLTFITLSLYGQNSKHINWQFKTGDRILSHPVVDGNTVYFGSLDSSIYALDINSGTKKWSFKTSSPIRSQAVVKGEILTFKSGNSVYALDPNNGEEIWSYLGNPVDKVQLDYWDYHSGSPAIYRSSVFFGFQNGRVLGFDLQTGKIAYEIKRENSAPVLSGLIIENGILYFGDWNGIVYAYNLDDDKLAWQKATYDEQPYPTFGQITGQLSMAGNMLYFGSRNPKLSVLDIRNGHTSWSYVESEGGWISGDPLIADNILYIGGSDNHEMLAFDALTGEVTWKFLFLNNNFSQPVIFQDYLLFTTGDAYTVFGNSPGKGYLYALDKSSGILKQFECIGGNNFTSLRVKNGNAYFGSSDGNFYSVNLNSFINDKISPQAKGHEAVTVEDITPNPFSEMCEISFNVLRNSPVEVYITDYNGNRVATLIDKIMEPGHYSTSWSATNDVGQTVANSLYAVELKTGEYVVKKLIQKGN